MSATIELGKLDTDRAEYSFMVREDGSGTPWIFLEPLNENLALLKAADGFLGFELEEGTDIRKAEEIAEFLNHHLLRVTCTSKIPL